MSLLLKLVKTGHRGSAVRDKRSDDTAAVVEEVVVAAPRRALSHRCVLPPGGLHRLDLFFADRPARFAFGLERFPDDRRLGIGPRPAAIDAAARPAVDAHHPHALGRGK